ncbi:type VI secretion system tip protein VgrG [uncultured Ruegeria sp.]|uniref:type VI secretion system tip protein VgrG n=1 Tax=uncultured Ruegeria sp. TaxID=259304 RepID=UPI0026168744|nr:type VI secretion system tip protein VgrG [uncultured Ruegeria sp.]
MAESVLFDGADLITFRLMVDGSEVSSVDMITSISVTRHINRIPSAEIVIADGDPSTQDFKVSDSATFVPGAEIEILMGYQSRDKSVFKGVIIRQGLRVGHDGRSVLTVGCSDKAIRLTIARVSQTFHEMTYSDAMKKLIADSDLQANVSEISGQMGHIVQSQSSAWDFLLSTAEAHGHVVIVEDGKVSVGPPKFVAPRYEVAFGETLAQMDIELRAVSQLSQVSSTSWDASQQELLHGISSEPSVNKQGNITGRELAEKLGVAEFGLQTSRPMDAGALKTWANAQLMKSRLSRITGTVSFPGNAGVMPGYLLQVEGVGKRFGGDAYVSGIHHYMSEGEWQTEATLGLDRRWFADLHRDVDEPQAAALTPGATGLQIAKVVQVYDDPDDGQRIKVKLPLSSPDQGIWVRLTSPYAGDKMGISFLPEVDDEVVVGFLNDDPNAPVVLGALHSSQRSLPFQPQETNAEKSIVTRSGLRIGFEDEKKILTIETPGKHIVTLSDEDKSITVVDSNNNKIEMSEGGVTLSTPKDMEISADGSISIKGQSGISISSPSDVSVAGGGVSIDAQEALSCTGNLSASFEATGEVTISGIMVSIN